MHRVAIDDDFAIELQNDPQHAMRTWMLRTHIEDDLMLAILELTSSVMV